MPLLDKLRLALPDLQLSNKTVAGDGWSKKSLFFNDGGGTYWIVITHTNNYAYLKVNYDWMEENSKLILNSPRIFVAWNEKHKIWYWLVGQDKQEPNITRRKNKQPGVKAG